MDNTLKAPTIDTDVNFWPAYIDMLTSVLMFFILIYFVQHNLDAKSLDAAIADRKRAESLNLFRSEFKPELDSGQIKISPETGFLRITFGERILFELGKYDLQHDGEDMLRRVGSVIHSLNQTSAPKQLYERIQIEGHTDDRRMDHSSYPHDNWELSSARALAVLRFMTERIKPPLDPSKLSANGYGDTRPVSRTDRDKNRRIEIRLYFSGTTQADASATAAQ